MNVDDELALRNVAYAYASAVDRRDETAFLAVFHPDACLRVGPDRVLRGHGELAQVIVRIARYRATFHQVGNTRYEFDGDTATGEVYCTAHHVGFDGSDKVLLIRYLDVYRRGDGGWRVVERSVVVEFEGQVGR